MLLGGSLWGVFGIKGRGTRYYVTSFRLVAARRDRIVQEVSRDIFRGREFSQFLEKIPTLIVNGTPFYSVKILNPQSGDILMTLKNMTQESVTALDAVGQIVYCRDCGQRNDAKSMTCSRCGASL